MTDWKSILRNGQHGVSVEGPDDKRIIEAFLNSGAQNQLWPDWTQTLRVEPAGHFTRVLTEIDDDREGTVWGIVDRDWRSDQEIADLIANRSRLLFLPRVMIDNFLIDDDTLLNLLPSTRRSRFNEDIFRAELDHHLGEWLRHGALSKALHESRADQFCRGNTGYPSRLTDTLIADEREITAILEEFRQQLDPGSFLLHYHRHLADFQGRSRDEQSRLCIDGKAFFNQAVIPLLNRFLEKTDRSTWLTRLFAETPTTIPADLESLLRQLIEHV